MRYTCGDCGLKFRWVLGEGIARYILVKDEEEEKKNVKLGGRPLPAHCPECKGMTIEEDNI